MIPRVLSSHILATSLSSAKNKGKFIDNIKQNKSGRAFRFLALEPESFAADIIYCSECHKPITDKVYRQENKRTKEIRLMHLHCALTLSLVTITTLLRKRAKNGNTSR